jgi:hypothetical protein
MNNRKGLFLRAPFIRNTVGQCQHASSRKEGSNENVQEECAVSALASTQSLAPVENSLAPHATVAPDDGSAWHDATVAPDATVARYAMVKGELRVPNTLNFSLFPTLDPFAGAVLHDARRIAERKYLSGTDSRSRSGARGHADRRYQLGTRCYPGTWCYRGTTCHH